MSTDFFKAKVTHFIEQHLIVFEKISFARYESISPISGSNDMSWFRVMIGGLNSVINSLLASTLFHVWS